MAERFWSQRSIRDVDSLYHRLSSLDVELEILGLRHGANSRKMLHRMTSEDCTAIQTLADILEPSKYYSRLFPRIQEAAKAGLGLTALPINDLSDAVLPESLPARTFHQDVKRMLSGKKPDPELKATIRARLAAVEPERRRIPENRPAILPAGQGHCGVLGREGARGGGA